MVPNPSCSIIILMVNPNSSLLPHIGDCRAKSTQSYVRTKESTKENFAKNVADVKLNTKRALFQTVKDVGGVSGAASTSSSSMKLHPGKTIKQKLGLTPGHQRKVMTLFLQC